MKSKITDKDMDKSVIHSRGGSGFAILERYPNKYCRVVAAGTQPSGKPFIGDQFFLASEPELSVQMVNSDPLNPISEMIECKLEDGVVGLLNEVRAKLKSGKFEIKSTRLVPFQKII